MRIFLVFNSGTGDGVYLKSLLANQACPIAFDFQFVGADYGSRILGSWFMAVGAANHAGQEMHF